VDCRPDREFDKALVARLGTCNYIEDHRNIMLLGASGSGKSWLACAFGVAAARSYYTVRYARLPDLLGELAVARADGSYRKLMAQLAKVQLLILDEWLLYDLREGDVREILEIVERRHKRPPPSSAPSTMSAAGTKSWASPP
jgi:DNA replication protein DnaC